MLVSEDVCNTVTSIIVFRQPDFSLQNVGTVRQEAIYLWFQFCFSSAFLRQDSFRFSPCLRASVV